jgi:photosystem II stability/assembly factor-like uncharacterized protein
MTRSLMRHVALVLWGTGSLAAQPVPTITAQSTPIRTHLQALHAVDTAVVWGAGAKGVVLRTRDGGATWELRPTPSGDSLAFRDVHAVSADTAWVLAIGNGRASRVYGTTDGGARWTLQFLNTDSTAFYDCLSFGTARDGLVFGDATHGRTQLLRTRDGATWTPVASTPPPLDNEGAFAASGQCLVHGDARTAFVATGAPEARLLRSRDGGRTWEVRATPFVRGAGAGLTGLAFDGPMRGIAVAADIGRLRTDTSSAVVGVTADGGDTWTLRPRPPLPGALAGVAWVPGASRETAVVVGYGGAFHTRTGGRSWTVITDRVMTGATSAGRTAWLSGADGCILRLDW